MSPPGKVLAEVVGRLEAGGYDIGSEELSGCRGTFPPTTPGALAAPQGADVSRHFPPAAWMGTARARDRVIATWGAADINTWLQSQAGPSIE